MKLSPETHVLVVILILVRVFHSFYFFTYLFLTVSFPLVKMVTIGT